MMVFIIQLLNYNLIHVKLPTETLSWDVNVNVARYLASDALIINHLCKAKGACVWLVWRTEHYDCYHLNRMQWCSPLS